VLLFTHLHHAFFADPMEDLYIFSTTSGRVIIVQRTVAAIWVFRNTKLTVHTYKSKKAFYSRFLYSQETYLMTLPLIAWIANTSLDVYVRQNVVTAVELLSMFSSQSVFVLLYNPDTRFNRSFPFHQCTADDLDPRQAQRTAASLRTQAQMEEANKKLTIRQQLVMRNGKKPTLQEEATETILSTMPQAIM